MLLTDGSAPAYADRGTLYVFNDHGVIILDTAPLFLASLIAGPPADSFFFDAALSLYAIEETGMAEGLTGQSSDAWAVLLQQKRALLPLSDAQAVEISCEIDRPEARILPLRSTMSCASISA